MQLRIDHFYILVHMLPLLQLLQPRIIRKEIYKMKEDNINTGLLIIRTKLINLEFFTSLTEE